MERIEKLKKVEEAFERRDVFRIDFSCDGMLVAFYYKVEGTANQDCIMLGMVDAMNVLQGRRVVTTVLV